MSKSKKNLTVKVGTDKNGKAIWKSCGVMIEGENGPYLLIDPTFNFAGVKLDDGKTSVLVSVFESEAKRSDDELPF